MKKREVTFNKLIDRLSNQLPFIQRTEFRIIMLVLGIITMLTLVVLLIVDIIPSEVEYAAGTGHYINVAGCGLSPAPGCALQARCNYSSGECTTQAGEYMFLWKCGGEVPDCREVQVAYNQTGTLDVNDENLCGGSVQLDVFNHNCRPFGEPYGGWTCDGNDLIDYMTWYWDSCDAPTPTPNITITPTPEPTPAVCDVSQIDLQFRIDCPSTDVNDTMCGGAISGATPIDSVWYQGSDITMHVANSNFVEIVDVRCVLDPTTNPKTLFSQGYVQVSIDNSPNPDQVIGTYSINAQNLDWNGIYAEYGDNIYKFKCVLTP
ncbi:hypothetical protein KC909_04145 [Candidatus Dojkabacteria bacterium]|uniref:Uncharacterized protein n=1 Tax=Candidatus Dojkabacteria bacterium TaxID=2099670 RepID=A0A955RJ85_9BACT|nr:hypothetical protein [Candidatus Dojkabacteria bacterium]